MTLDYIKAKADEAASKASAEPSQSSYNAAWLHGYAQALRELADQMGKGE